VAPAVRDDSLRMRAGVRVVAAEDVLRLPRRCLVVSFVVLSLRCSRVADSPDHPRAWDLD
jgi:hypothetical protein